MFFTFSLGYFVIRLLVGIGLTGLVLSFVEPQSFRNYVRYVLLASLAACLPIGVATNHILSLILAGLVQAAVFLSIAPFYWRARG